MFAAATVCSGAICVSEEASATAISKTQRAFWLLARPHSGRLFHLCQSKIQVKLDPLGEMLSLTRASRYCLCDVEGAYPAFERS